MFIVILLSAHAQPEGKVTVDSAFPFVPFRLVGTTGFALLTVRVYSAVSVSYSSVAAAVAVIVVVPALSMVTTPVASTVATLSSLLV